MSLSSTKNKTLKKRKFWNSWKIPYNTKGGFFQFSVRFFIMWYSKKIYAFYEFFGNPSKVSRQYENDKENEKSSLVMLGMFQGLQNCICH